MTTTTLKQALDNHPLGTAWRGHLAGLIDLCQSHNITPDTVEPLSDDQLLVGALSGDRLLLIHDDALTVLHSVWSLSRTHRDAQDNPVTRRYFADVSGLKTLPSGEYNAQFMYHCVCAEEGVYRELMPTIQANQVDHPSDAYIFSTAQSAKAHQWLVA